MPELLLDVSELEPCEPLELTLEATAQLKPGDWIKVLHRQEPFPLYPLLEQQDLCWKTQAGQTSAYEILIWRCTDPDAAAAIQGISRD